jgi:hypothetical protein
MPRWDCLLCAIAPEHENSTQSQAIQSCSHAQHSSTNKTYKLKNCPDVNQQAAMHDVGSENLTDLSPPHEAIFFPDLDHATLHTCSHMRDANRQCSEVLWPQDADHGRADAIVWPPWGLGLRAQSCARLRSNVHDCVSLPGLDARAGRPQAETPTLSCSFTCLRWRSEKGWRAVCYQSPHSRPRLPRVLSCVLSSCCRFTSRWTTTLPRR